MLWCWWEGRCHRGRQNDIWNPCSCCFAHSSAGVLCLFLIGALQEGCGPHREQSSEAQETWPSRKGRLSCSERKSELVNHLKGCFLTSAAGWRGSQRIFRPRALVWVCGQEEQEARSRCLGSLALSLANAWESWWDEHLSGLVCVPQSRGWTGWSPKTLLNPRPSCPVGLHGFSF